MASYCSCWQRDGNDALHRETCTREERREHEENRYKGCGDIDGKLSRQEAEDESKRMNKEVVQRRAEGEAEEEARTGESQQEADEDDRRFLRELNQGRTQGD